MRNKTQLVVRRAEALAAAAQELADVTGGPESLSLGGLSPAMVATGRAALHQAATYERWAGDAARVDPLLGRALLGLARTFRDLSEEAARVAEDVPDALDALDGEESAPG
jgi:hypothetical protein